MKQIATRFNKTGPSFGECPLHPNPYFERSNFVLLDGEWEFAITKQSDFPEEYAKRIFVPFAVETAASGINQPVEKDDFLHYRREVILRDQDLKCSILLHFAAIDQIADIYWNGSLIAHHEGGYHSFSVEILPIQKENVLQVVVEDDTSSSIFARGKQSVAPGGIWYTPTSGIWQSVWYEAVPTRGYLNSFMAETDFKERTLSLKCLFHGTPGMYRANLFHNNELVGSAVVNKEGNASFDLKDHFYPWSPEFPDLYTLQITDGVDTVKSVVGIRKVESVYINGRKYLFLNGEPFFANGLLDQGYYPESGLTPPSDEAMVADIELAKSLGFNMLRKHIKVEPMRWYYHCDRLGIFVIQDLVNGGAPYNPAYVAIVPTIGFKIDDVDTDKLGRGEEASRQQFLKEMKQTVAQLSPVTSICVWTLFNEGWGQFNAVENCRKLRELDPTRLIDATSGWHDKGVGDFCSRHIYFVSPKPKNDGKRVLSLSEFGGYSLFDKEHSWSDKKFGYRVYPTQEKLMKALEKLYLGPVLSTIQKEGLSVLVYTQLTDVEDEVNGLITYDRERLKVDPEKIKEINETLRKAYAEAVEKARGYDQGHLL